MQIIHRNNFSDVFGTRSEWILDGQHFCYFLEPQNPTLTPGDYVLFRFFSAKHGKIVLRFYKVGDPVWNALHPDEVHTGNIYVDTTGCTLPGTGYAPIDCAAAYPEGDARHDLKNPINGTSLIPGIVGSQATFDRIMRMIPDATPVHVEGIVES
jgi:hypothetical protein